MSNPTSVSSITMHVQLIQQITIHFCGSSSSALDLVNTVGKYISVFQLPVFTATTAHTMNVLQAATVLKRAIVTCQDWPLQHLHSERLWLKQHIQLG